MEALQHPGAFVVLVVLLIADGTLHIHGLPRGRSCRSSWVPLLGSWDSIPCHDGRQGGRVSGAQWWQDESCRWIFNRWRSKSAKRKKQLQQQLPVYTSVRLWDFQRPMWHLKKSSSSSFMKRFHSLWVIAFIQLTTQTSEAPPPTLCVPARMHDTIRACPRSCEIKKTTTTKATVEPWRGSNKSRRLMLLACVFEHVLLLYVRDVWDDSTPTGPLHVDRIHCCDKQAKKDYKW